MSFLELAFADGQMAALARHKVAWMSATSPVVSQSQVLKPSGAKPPQVDVPPASATPDTVKQTFTLHEQGETRTEPRRKLSEEMCTSCRRPKHYGSCKRPIAIKKGDFNLGMTADDAPTENPSTSPHYHSATSADTALARARDAQPADVQAQTAFADLYRHLGITSVADQATQTTSGLDKVSGISKGLLDAAERATTSNAATLRAAAHDAGKELAKHLASGGTKSQINSRSLLEAGRAARSLGKSKLADFMLPGTEGHSMSEQRGPSVNPYEERRTVMGPPAGFGDEGLQRIERAFSQIDGAVDSTSIEDAAKGPQPGPLA